MAESSISVAIRIRPFSAKESAQLAPKDDYQPFLGDGGLSAGSTSRPISGGTGPGLRTKYLRSIVSPVDDKVLIFDPPESRTTASSSSSSSQNTFSHGARKPRDVRYAFDRVLDDTCSQETVFEKTTKPLLDGILNGFNASVFAYGATGCGKTHTISGTADDPGVIFLTMRELYKRIEDSKDDFEVSVRLSYLEIYNEQIRDLLSPTPTPPGSGLMLREDAANKISVMGITEHTPESPEGVLQMIYDGNQRRTMSPTEANAVSSRSHAVLQINVMQRPRTADTVMETTSASLNIIDLAGSERAAATRNDGARMKEGANINKSLLALGNCINALCQSAGQKNRHIPYRNSKLTRLLKFSLGGNCKTVMIVCVSPSSAHYDETHNTLKYANQAKNIRTKVSRNMLNIDRHVAQYVQAIHALKEEVAELKAKLADRAAVESAGEKRRKVEMAREMDEVKLRIQTSTSDMKVAIGQKAGLQGLLLAAKVRLASLRQRLQQLEAECDTGNAAAADVECERQVLRKIIGRQEAILSDRTLQGEAQNLVNSMQAHKAVLLAASNNVKFDEEATRSIRVIGDQLNAELEMCRTQAISEAFSKQLAAGMAVLADFAVLGSRSTMALKEAAMKIEAQSESSAEQRSALIDQMSAVAQMNDALFTSHVGMQTIEFAAQLAVAKSTATAKEPRPSVLRRARSSVSAQLQASQATSAPSAAMSAVARLSKRQSRSSLMPNTSIAGNPLLTSKAPRRPSNPMRRSSIGMRRVSSTSRKSIQSAVSTSATSIQAPVTAPAAKKAFRWADEAGEGKIDDKSASSVEGMLPPKARTSNGPSQSIRTSLGLQSSASASAPPPVAVESEKSNSSAEWEDVSKDVAKGGIRLPLATAALNVNGSSATEVPSLAAKAKPQGSIFERNFLRKKISSTSESGTRRSSDEMDAMDTDDSLLGIGEDNTSKADDDSIASCPSKPPANNARSSPYRRPSATLLEAVKKNGALGNGVGPIRNKGRSSGSLDSPTRKSVASLAASINGRATQASRSTGASNAGRS